MATVTEPSVRARTQVISPEGSACAMEPTVVPRLRIAGWAAVAEQCVVPDERTDPHAVPGGLDRVEAGHPVDVDQGRRCRQPHRQQRQQRLTTGQHLGALTLLRENREGLVEGAGIGVTERCRFHFSRVPYRLECGVPGRPS
jgi:hypothetical protein